MCPQTSERGQNSPLEREQHPDRSHFCQESSPRVSSSVAHAWDTPSPRSGFTARLNFKRENCCPVTRETEAKKRYLLSFYFLSRCRRRRGTAQVPSARCPPEKDGPYPPPEAGGSSQAHTPRNVAPVRSSVSHAEVTSPVPGRPLASQSGVGDWLCFAGVTVCVKGADGVLCVSALGGCPGAIPSAVLPCE